MEPDDSQSTPEQRPTARRRRGTGRDPVASALGLGILIAVIVTLGAVVYVLYAGLFGAKAPRTAVERQLQVLETYTSENPQSPYAWADYLKALTLTEQYVKAGQVLDEVTALLETEPLLLVEKGRLLAATGEVEDALSTLDEAIALAVGQRDERLADLESRGVAGMVTDPYGAWIATAAILKTGIYQDRGDWAMVVEASSRALEESPTMADMLVVRGFAHVELGNDDAAEADFRAALELIPEYEEALNGLDAIDAEAGDQDE